MRYIVTDFITISSTAVNMKSFIVLSQWMISSFFEDPCYLERGWELSPARNIIWPSLLGFFNLCQQESELGLIRLFSCNTAHRSCMANRYFSFHSLLNGLQFIYHLFTKTFIFCHILLKRHHLRKNPKIRYFQ